MASRAKPEINERWWKQSWPIEGGTPEKYGPVASAIKVYKTAKRGKSAGDLVEALNRVDITLKDSLKASSAALAKLDKKQAKLFTDDVAAVLKIAQARKSDALRLGSATQIVYSRDISKELNARFFKAKKGPLKLDTLNVEFDLLVAVVNEIKAKGGDALLSRGYNDLVDDTIDAIEDEVIRKSDAIYAKPGDPKIAFKKIIDGHLLALHRDASKVPTNLLRRLGIYGDVQKTYETRMLKKTGKAALSTVSAVAAAGAIALPGTPALAIVGCAMAVTSAARDIADAAMTLEQKAKVVSKYMKVEQKRLLKMRDSAAAREFGPALLNELTTDLAPTLKKCKNDMKDLEKGVQILMHRVIVKQTNIGNAIDYMDKVNAELKDEIKKKSSVTKLSAEQIKELKAFEKKVKRAEAYVGKMAGAASDMTGRGLKLESHFDRLKRRLDAMELAQDKVKSVQNIADFVGVLATIGMAAGGIADAVVQSKAEDVVKQAKGIIAISIATTAAAKDMVVLAKDAV